MKQIAFKQIVTARLSEGAILNEEYAGFKQDYLVLHCLLRKHQPKKFLEIGTNFGTGTKIIKNALGANSEVFSLDLPTNLIHQSLLNPNDSQYGGDKVGSRCDLPFTQLRGDSITYDYAPHYPLDGWFIDGAHDYMHPHHEGLRAMESGAKLILWHDANMVSVNFAIQDLARLAINYDFFRVKDTRIAYALKTKDVKY